MSLPELSIKRHVLAYMVSAVLVLFGIISYERLGVDRFPYIEFPVISITTTLQGANPDIVDASITNVIETAVNSTPGIDHIQSTSSPGVSVVAITFNLDKNIDIAFNEVQSKVNQVLRQLPRDTDPPIVAKVQTGAQPIMWLALQGDRTLQQLNVYARNVIKKRLETIDGVGEVRLGGERKRVIRVALDTDRMAAYGVAAQDVTSAFSREHLQLPGGFLVSKNTENLIKLDLEFHSLADLRQMVVAYKGQAPIRLQDIATVEDSLADYRQLARFNGKPTVGIGIVKVPNTNTVAIVDAVKERLAKDILPQLPPGMTLKVASNDASYIEEMVASLKEHIGMGTLLAALVVWLFLRSVRSTLIIAVAIPVSLLGAVAVMYFSGFTFNSLTLLALLLLIGVVVDDAIVVLENIFRHREKIDRDPVSAAVNGSRQVVFAVLAATLTLVSIFAPVIFMGGIIGKFFRSFAVVVTFGVLVSLLVSMTLTPMLCSRYLNVSQKHGRLYYFLDHQFARLDAFYRRLLTYALEYPWRILGLATVIVLSSVFFFASIGKGFAPEEDEGRFMVMFRTPLGSSIDYTDSRLREVEAVLGRHKEIATYFSAIGLGQAGQVNQGLAFVRMVPRAERKLTQFELIPLLRQELSQIPGVRAFAAPVPLVGGMRGEPLQFVLTGPNLEEVAHLSDALQQRLAAEPGVGRLDLDLQLNLPQVKLRIDRSRTASLGLSAEDVGAAVNLLAGGMDIAKYNDEPGDGERYDVRIKAREGELQQPEDLSRIFLRGSRGQLVRLDTVANFDQALGAAVISRSDLQYAANFYGSPSIPLGEAVAKVNAAAKDLLPLGYKVRLMGEAEEFGKTISSVGFAFVLAMVLLYMVLASQFNSFLQPFIIMLAQPLAIVGGVFALWLFNKVFMINAMTLNIFSMIGLLLLIGLVAKNSILLVDLTNQLRAEGRDIRSALAEACPIRMRPVLMTSLTIILAELPAAVGLGAGAQTNGPLAVAVIGGMISSTLLTLVVVPAVYLLLEERVLRWRTGGQTLSTESV
jgi:HAE1 family hydrophobic/amphiphilic exporter-1